MSLANLKSLARRFARVDDSVVSRVDDLPLLTSDETIAILDAIKEHSKRYPRVRSIELPAPATWDVALSAVSGWGPDHKVESVRHCLNSQEWIEIEAKDLWTYQAPNGSYQLRFLCAPPTAAFWLSYSMPHVLTNSQDTFSDERPGEIEAVCHLAAANILRMAANSAQRQYKSNLGAESANTEQQAPNYAARSREERQEYLNRLSQAETGNGFVDWGYPSAGREELFWRPSRYR